MASEPATHPELAESYGQRMRGIEEEQTSISLISILHVLMLRKRTILAVASACFAIAAAVAFVLPPQYTSVAAIIPPAATGSASAALVGQLSALGAGSLLGSAGPKNPADLYVGILKSRSIADEMVKQFDLKAVYKQKRQAATEKILAARSRFEVEPKTFIIRLSVSDTSPTRARDMTQKYLDLLRATNDRLAISESSQRRLFFEQQLAKEKDDLENAEVDLKKTEEKSGLIAPSGQTASEIQTIAATRAEITARQVELAGLRRFVTEQNPDVIRLESEITSLQGQLARLQAGKEKDAGGPIPASMAPELQLDYVRKEREVKYHESLFEILAKQYEAARLDEAHDAPLLQVLDTPSYPEQKSSPHRLLIALVGGIVGLLIGSLGVLVSDYIRALRQSRLNP